MEILLKLFLTFLKIGLVSIGGGYAVIPSIHEEVVVKAGWIGEKVFADIITISQMTPGPLAVNTSTFVACRSQVRQARLWQQSDAFFAELRFH